MSKELETLKKLLSFAFVMSENMVGLTKGNYDEGTFIKKTYEYLHKYSVDLHSRLELKQALQRLESIDNANPSEALECLESFKNEYVPDYQGNAVSMLDWYKEQFDNIKQALLKSQEQEKENARYKQLEEQLGCPLEIVHKALKYGIYTKDSSKENKINYRPAVSLSNVDTEWYLSNHIDYCVNVKDYGILFWLKEDKSE